jgi:hypothetical protein
MLTSSPGLRCETLLSRYVCRVGLDRGLGSTGAVAGVHTGNPVDPWVDPPDGEAFGASSTADYGSCAHSVAFLLRERGEPCANAAARGRVQWGFQVGPGLPLVTVVLVVVVVGLPLRDYVSSASFRNFSQGVSLARTEPEGLRFKSDLRNHRAIVQPRFFTFWCAYLYSTR